jgi:GDP-L-fucose synthase
VIPALLRKFQEAKLRQSAQGEGQRELVEGDSELVELWGTGSPMREFLHVDDLADACIHFMQNYSEAGHVNIGTGTDMTIKELAEMIAEIVGYQGDIFWNTSYPDGTPRKLLDVSKASSLGWKATTSLADGLRQVYKEKFLEA